MKIVHINTNDSIGGAAIACARHCEAMLSWGIDSTMLVLNKRSKLDFVKKLHLGLNHFLSFYYEARYVKLLRKLNAFGSFSLMKYGQPFYKDEDVVNADIIFLHWINGNALSLDGVEKILKLGKPTYWYLHDMLPITGGCHHSLSCNKYTTNCKDCPLINNKKLKYLASLELSKKIKQIRKYTNLSFIAPSIWLADCIRASSMAVGHKTYVVPNLIDTNIYRPIPINAKEIFGLDPNKKTILFGATSNSIYKGWDYMRHFLSLLDPSDYEGLIMGPVDKKLLSGFNINIIFTGYLTDDISKVIAYNACDTFVISSIAENYPNVLLEAMSCGKPCVGFPIGGIKDLIHHGISGFVTQNIDYIQLLDGIEYLFSDDARYQDLSTSAREQIVNNNSYEQFLHAHKEYKSLIFEK